MSFAFTPLDIGLIIFAVYLWLVGGFYIGRSYVMDTNGTTRDHVIAMLTWPVLVVFFHALTVFEKTVEWIWSLSRGGRK